MIFSWEENVLPLDNLQNLYNLLNVPYLVGGVGFEPTHPEETGLQPAAALQLYRPPIFNLLVGQAGIEPATLGFSVQCSTS